MLKEKATRMGKDGIKMLKSQIGAEYLCDSFQKGLKTIMACSSDWVLLLNKMLMEYPSINVE